MQDYFYVRRERKYEQVRFADIIFVKSVKGHCIQIVTEQKTFLLLNSLPVIEKYLPKELFCRIHHRHIVALSRIKAFDLYSVYLHEAPADKPYKQGLARTMELAIGITRRQKLLVSLKIVSNIQGGYHKGFKKLIMDLQEMELDNNSN